MAPPNKMYTKPKARFVEDFTTLQDPQSGAWSTILDVTLPFNPIVRYNGWTRKALARYTNYPKLYGERKYASNYPLKGASFLDLPPEIRNHIYGHLFHFGYVELAAKAASGAINYGARVQHMSFYKHTIVPNLKLWRTCKQINREAAPFFYGDNEFRFTAIYGFDILLPFCRTVGKANTKLLRKIAEHVPWGGVCLSDRDYQSDRPAHDGVNCWNGFKYLLSKMGLHGEGYGAWKFNIPRTSGKNLKTYRLVVPDSFMLLEDEDDEAPERSSLLRFLSEGQMNEAEVQLVMLDNQTVDSSGASYTARNAFRDKRRELRGYAKKMGWSVLETPVSEHGSY